MQIKTTSEISRELDKAVNEVMIMRDNLSCDNREIVRTKKWVSVDSLKERLNDFIKEAESVPSDKRLSYYAINLAWFVDKELEGE